MKEKRENKPKDQITWEMKQRQEAQRKRQFVAEQFFPMLLTHLKTVTQAKNFCKVVQNDILSTFNQGMSKPLKELDMAKRFEGLEENEASKAYGAVLEIFKESPVNEALELLDGMPGAIEAALAANDKNRLMSDLEWNDGALTVKPTAGYSPEKLAEAIQKTHD